MISNYYELFVAEKGSYDFWGYARSAHWLYSMYFLLSAFSHPFIAQYV